MLKGYKNIDELKEFIKNLDDPNKILEHPKMFTDKGFIEEIKAFLELYDKGYTEQVNIKEGKLYNEKVGGFSIYTLKKKYKNQFNEFIVSMINKNADHSADLSFNQYKQEIEFYPKTERHKKALKIIDDLVKEIGSENLFRSDEQAIKMQIGMSYFYKDVLAFFNGNEFKVMVKPIENIVSVKTKTLLINKIKDTFNTTKKKAQNLETYTWLGKPEDELPELYKLMVNNGDNGYLAPESTIEQFKAVFEGKPINEDFKPLKWLKSASELLYFIIRLQETQNIKSGKRLNHKRMIACFVDSESKKFNQNFSVLANQLKEDLKNPLSPDKRHDIDTIIDQF